MKKLSRVLAVVLAVCLLAGLFLLPAGAEQDPLYRGEGLTVLFTHDTHDHFYPDANGVGGYTRLATALNTERANAQYPTITVDGGDFSMGSLFQTVYATDAPELRALGRMGYDVVTLGNHEFDYRQKGLAEMLHTAAQVRDGSFSAMVSSQSGAIERAVEQFGILSGRMPAIVQANYTTAQDPATSEAQLLAAAFANYPVTPYTSLEKDGVTVAVFGVMGVDSDECAPMSGMVYEPMVDAAKRVVKEIQEKVKPDFIICLSHGGTDKGKGEDYELAKAVDGIDLIISGHTHTTLDEPIVVNGTPIVSCGPYTQNLGVITLWSDSDRFDYKLVPIDDSISPDAEMTTLAEYFKTKVDSSYLSDYNMSYDGVLTVAESDFTIPQTGVLIGEAYIDTVREVEGTAYDPISFAVAPDGVIRGVLRQGEVTASQAFDILSLGSGADGSPGYPLVSVYLTGKDMKNVFEVDASISALMPAATLYGAGSWWHYNPNRMFLDKVTECQASDGYGGEAGPFADDKLYRVVADLYSGQMLAAVKDKSFGLLSITPRDRNGDPVTNFEDHIIHDSQGRELKAWQAFATYLDKQESVTPTDPAAVKRAIPSWNPIHLLIPMGAPTAVVVILILLVVLVVILVVRRVVRKRRKKSYNSYKGKR